MLGEFALYGEIAAGGMATIHFGRLLAPNGEARTVAIKRLHPQFAKDAEFRTMFLDEARVAVHVTHPNVVTTLDVVGMENELFLVMEYVPGESLSRLIRLTREKKKLIPPRIVAAILAGSLRGLHAAHEARDAAGRPLQIVHRDISPQNVLIGTDGVSRVLDFGVAKAVGRHQQTREGQLKGKIAYMAPEQLNGHVTPRTDIYAAGVTLWEALTARRLFNADNEAAILGKILSGAVDPPSMHTPSVDPSTDLMMKRLDAIVLRALARDPADRFETALAMAEALEQLPLATNVEVGKFTEKTAHEALKRRATVLAAIEKNGSRMPLPLPLPAPESSSEPRTQIAVSHSSSSSSATPPAIVPPRRMPPRRRQSMLLLGAGVLALALLFAAVGAVVAVRSNDQSNIPPARANTPPPPVDPSIAPDPPKQNQPPAEAAPPPSAGPSSRVAPSGVPSGAPSSTAKVIRQYRPPTPPKRKCEPSFIDEQGHKQYNADCLGSGG